MCSASVVSASSASASSTVPSAEQEQCSGGGSQQALLQAVRPYLSEKRQRKIDRAIQITRMAHLAKLAMEGLGGSEHAETLSGQQRTL